MPSEVLVAVFEVTVARLLFGRTQSNTGFTSGNAAEFGDGRPARVIRELIQNSLDAAVDAREPMARMCFELTEVRRDEIPGLDDLIKALNRAKEYQVDFQNGRLTDASQEVVDRMEAALAGDDPLPLLTVSDNGVGFDQKRMQSILSDGASAKATGAGSYGVGHHSFSGLSDLRYVLYGGLNATGTRIVAGSVLLASHVREKHIRDARGFLVDEFLSGVGGCLYKFLNAGDHPPVISKWIDRVASDWSHGAVILIPAFNRFRRKSVVLWDLVSRVAAYNFSPAIFRGQLEVSVVEGDVHRTLSESSLEATLRKGRDSTRAARSDGPYAGLRPSGGAAYSIFEALREGSTPIRTESGAVRLSLKTPSGDHNTRVDLFRDGMWITDKAPKLCRADFASTQPFQAVIEILEEDGADLYQLVRKAEGPMHDKLAEALLSDTEKVHFLSALGSLGEQIEKLVPVVNTDEYSVPDFLTVPTGDVAESGNKDFAFWGGPVAMPRTRIQAREGPLPTPVPDPPPSPNPSPPRPPQPKPRRPLGFQSVVVPDGPGRLVGSVVVRGSCRDALLRILVDENTDSTCDHVWDDEFVVVKKMQIESDSKGPDGTAPMIHIEPSGWIRIRNIQENVRYTLRIRYEDPSVSPHRGEPPVFRIELIRPVGGRTSIVGISEGSKVEDR